LLFPFGGYVRHKALIYPLGLIEAIAANALYPALIERWRAQF